MKKLILLASAAALASCGGGADEAATDDTVTVEDDSAMTADADMTTDYVGTHTVYDADGNMLGTTVAAADGSYSDTNADGTTGGGTWEVNDAGQLCFDEDGDDAGSTCWTKGDMVDGRQAWSNDAGETVYVTFNA